MKQIQHTIVLLSLCSFISITGCKKEAEIKTAALPEATQMGKNTLGFVVNGDTWLPSYKCSFGGNACGEAEVSYNVTAFPQTIFTLNVNRRLQKLSSLNIIVKPGATITSTGNKADSIRAIYISEKWEGSTNPGRYIGPLAGSNFIITRVDTQSKIIAGTFELLMADSVDNSSRVTLEKGRFDFQFVTCHCSN